MNHSDEDKWHKYEYFLHICGDEPLPWTDLSAYHVFSPYMWR